MKSLCGRILVRPFFTHPLRLSITSHVTCNRVRNNLDPAQEATEIITLTNVIKDTANISGAMT